MTTAIAHERPAAVRLGLRENAAQFTLLVVVNAFVGAMVGMERSILPPIAEQEFHLAARTAVLSFIVVFGVSKALTNYLAGRLADRVGRKHVLVAGWLVAVPVPFMLMWGPTWNWILAANVLLGISQGFTWSTTVIMKIDLVGPARRGLAMGLNEFAGYVAVAGARSRPVDRRAHRLAAGAVLSGVVFVALGLGSLARCSCARRRLTSRWKPTLGDVIGRSHRRPRRVLAHDADRSQSLDGQSGRTRQQPERRHGVGSVPAVLRRRQHEPGSHRHAGGDLSGDVGHCAARRPERCPIASDGSG